MRALRQYIDSWIRDRRRATGGVRKLRLERLECRVTPTVLADFNGDGFADLAIGVPYANDSEFIAMGAVHIAYGSADGLSPTGAQTWKLDDASYFQTGRTLDYFGSSLASGDFNGDGFGDLAIGVPGRSVGSAVGAGAIQMLYGSEAGLAPSLLEQFFTQDDFLGAGKAQTFSRFGQSLVAGDFTGDGVTDLAVGAPQESIGSLYQCGRVHILQGSIFGLVPTTQVVIPTGAAAQNSAYFGYTLAAGDFGGNGRDDFAIGIPYLDVLGKKDAGGVLVNGKLWTQDSLKQPYAAYDHFGMTLAAGDFNGDANDDLAIGSPDQKVNGKSRAGAVDVVYGSTIVGLNEFDRQRWTADSYGLIGESSAQGTFGVALAVGDFNGDRRDDLAISSAGVRGGDVRVVLGSSHRLTPAYNSYLWTGQSLENYGFGRSLTAGDFDGDGYADLAVGAPYYSARVNNVWIKFVGAVSVFNGAAGWGGATISQSDQFVTGPSVGIELEKNSYFGSALAAGGVLSVGSEFASFAGSSPDHASVGNPGRALISQLTPSRVASRPLDVPRPDYSWWVQALERSGLPAGVPPEFAALERFSPVVESPTPRVATPTVTLAWQSVDGATSYEVWLRDTTTRRVLIHQTVTGNRLPTMLTIGHAYEWQVRALDERGPLGFWSTPAAFSVFLPAPVPTPTVDWIRGTMPVFRWEAVPYARRYDVRITDATTGRPVAHVNGIIDLSWLFRGRLIDGHSYTWSVRARTATGIVSDWSEALTFTRPE